MITLYGYWRSSAAYRVRIALNLKALNYEQTSVHLVKNGGEQNQEEYQQLNPAKLVPTLIDNDFSLTQSLAIIEYLEDKYPKISLYPDDICQKAIARALALDIACDVHPLNNLRVLQYLENVLTTGSDAKTTWYHYWVHQGFKAFETQLQKTSGKFCVGDTISMADVYLIPQVYNADRFSIDLSTYPLIVSIAERCNQHKAFIDALPENQPDAQ